jgi:polyphosphate kinase
MMQNAYIKLKMNSIVLYKMIDKLWNWVEQVLKFKWLLEFALLYYPGIKGMSENIEIISIIDKFFRAHAFVYIL